MKESLEARERDPEKSALDFDDEKMLVQMNILKTIEQLTSSLEGTDLLDKVEATIAPALEVVIRNNMVGKLLCLECSYHFASGPDDYPLRRRTL